MPQTFQVLRCYKCLFFQVHQTNKSNKFSCKMCGEKQSIKRHYGLGTGQECRVHVQKLNGIRGECDEQSDDIATGNSDDEETSESTPVPITQSKNSKWSNFIDANDNNEPITNEPMYLDNTEVVLEVPVARKRFKPNVVAKNNPAQTDCAYTNAIENKTENTKANNSLTINDPNTKYKHLEEKVLKSKIKKEVNPVKVINNSKWAQFTEYDDVDIEENSADEKTHIENPKNVNEDSKIVQYYEDFNGFVVHKEDSVKKESTNKTDLVYKKELNLEKHEVPIPLKAQLDSGEETLVNYSIFSTYDENELDCILEV